MFANRFLNLLVVIFLIAFAVLLVRDASATAVVVSNVDSGTRSYAGWAEAMELESVDSATRSYIGWARAAECGRDPAFDNNVDSATSSYVGWAKYVQCH